MDDSEPSTNDSTHLTTLFLHLGSGVLGHSFTGEGILLLMSVKGTGMEWYEPDNNLLLLHSTYNILWHTSKSDGSAKAVSSLG